MGNTKIPYDSAGACIFKDSALTINFSLPPPNITLINMISLPTDPWIIPTPDQIDSFGDSMLLSPLEHAYKGIVFSSTDGSKSHAIFSMNLNTYVKSPWLGSFGSLDPLNKTFPTDESIVGVMFLDETP